MFEVVLEDMVATVYVTDKDARCVDQYGCPMVRGPLRLTFHEAVELVHKLDRLSLSVPKWQLKRFRSFRNQVAAAFGPEFESFIARGNDGHVCSLRK